MTKMFMVQSSTGITHAVNPKTLKTYCGKSPEKWGVLDVLPSDDHKPTCEICLVHYDEPIREALNQIVSNLKENINEFLALKLILKDVEGLRRFTRTIKIFMSEETKRKRKEASEEKE